MNAPIDLCGIIPAGDESADSLVIANVSRRKFLRGASAIGGGLVLAVGFPAALRAADPPKYGADGMPHGWVDSPLVFVAIGEDGIVSIVCHRSEMGQGVRTGMPMIVADEMEADWSRVRVVQAPGDEARFGNQDTDGSRSTRHFSCPCAVAAPRRGKCSRRQPRRAGRSLSARCRPGTAKSCTFRPGAIWDMGRSPKPRRRCPCRRWKPFASRTRRSSAISAPAS